MTFKGYTNREFKPLYKLIKSFPGMKQPVGTIFGRVHGDLGTKEGHFSTAWRNSYFEPWVGEFFEEIKPKIRE